VVEEQLAHIGVGCLVLEDARAADAGPAHAGAGEQLAPATGRFRMRDVNRFGVECDLPGPEPGDRDKSAADVELQQQVLAFLGTHVVVSGGSVGDGVVTAPAGAPSRLSGAAS